MQVQKLEQNGLFLHEQLALRRLRRRQRWRPWRWLARVNRLLLNVLEPVELVQLVGPDQPPKRRDEWERRDLRPFC